MSKQINRRRFLRDVLSGSGLALAALVRWGRNQFSWQTVCGPHRRGLSKPGETRATTGAADFDSISSVGHSFGVSTGESWGHSVGYADSVGYVHACAGCGLTDGLSKLPKLVMSGGLGDSFVWPSRFSTWPPDGSRNRGIDPDDPTQALPAPAGPEGF